jgi:hypothetical protein
MLLIHLVSNHFSRPVDDASQRGRENCARGGRRPADPGRDPTPQATQSGSEGISPRKISSAFTSAMNLAT